MVYKYGDIARILNISKLTVLNWHQWKVVKAEHQTEDKKKFPRYSLIDLYAIAIYVELRESKLFSKLMMVELTHKWREKSLKLGKPLGTMTHWIPNPKIKAKKPVSLVAILLNAAPIVEATDKAILVAERKEARALDTPMERKRAPYAKPVYGPQGDDFEDLPF